MRELDIVCKGIGNISFQNHAGTVTLEEVDMSFLEELPAKVIVGNHSNSALLLAMDYDDVCEALELYYNVKITKG